MQFEQAIFASAKTSNIRGYHLVGKSPGIDSQLAQILSKWSPSHDGLVARDDWTSSLNFFQINNSMFALSRTVYGGPEYSRRGGLQVVTYIIVARGDQLAPYQNNPCMLADIALSMGYMRLETRIEQKLDCLEIPNRSFFRYVDIEHDEDPTHVRKVLRGLQENERVAVAGVGRPQRFMRSLLQQLPERQRLSISFSTGLNPSSQRKFRLHFLRSVDRTTRSTLVNQRISFLPIEDESVYV